jgi:hypothetical protein
VTDEPLGTLYDIEETYAQADLLNDLVRILGVDGILDILSAGSADDLWLNLYQVFDR